MIGLIIAIALIAAVGITAAVLTERQPKDQGIRHE